MRIHYFVTLLLPFVLVQAVLADPPRKPNYQQFAKLANQSPFTIKPDPKAPEPSMTPLERDWMLGSIRSVGGGYSVTLINKKDRKERIRFAPGFKSGDFKLLEVKQDTNKSLNSRVYVRRGSQTAWLTYDEKLIKIKPSATARKAPSRTNVSGRNGTARPSANRPPVPGGRSANTSRTGRQRTVPRRNR